VSEGERNIAERKAWRCGTIYIIVWHGVYRTNVVRKTVGCLWCQASLQDSFCRFSGDIWMAAVQNHFLLHVVKMATHVTSCISSTKLCNRLYDTASLKYQIWTISTLLVIFIINNFSCNLNHV
jgi:hypothetical protein